MKTIPQEVKETIHLLLEPRVDKMIKLRAEFNKLANECSQFVQDDALEVDYIEEMIMGNDTKEHILNDMETTWLDHQADLMAEQELTKGGI